MRFSRSLVSAGLVASALLSGCINAEVRESNIYRPRPGAALSLQDLARQAPEYSLEPQAITAADGVILRGVLLRRPHAVRTVLYFGGNNFLVGESAARLAHLLAPLNVDLMIVDYRGYGASGEGSTPTVQALKRDALSVYDYLTALPGMSPAGVVVHGQSLGSFMAGYVAASRPTAGLVLESSATTADDFARAQIPLLARPLLRVHIDESLRAEGNLQHMARLDEPLLVLVGDHDATTPAAMSRALFSASTLSPSRKRLAVITGAGHNDVLEHQTAIAAYAEFLRLTGVRGAG